MPAFAPSLPMFMTPGLLGLDTELQGALQGFDLAQHNATRAVAQLREAGVFSLLVPADHGGRALDAVSSARVSVRALCLAREALGYRSPLADSIFAVQGLGSHSFVLAQHQPNALPLAKQVLSEIVDGTRVGAFALTEPEAGSDVASMCTVAQATGDGYVLHGEKVFISNAGICSHYIVFANANPELGKKGISAFLVDAHAEGLRVSQVPMSLEHPLGRLQFSGTKARALIGEEGQGLRLALGTLDVFRTSVGAAACGMAKRALDETLARVRSRVQFGKPLAERELVQEKLATMATELDAARLLVYRAAYLKDQGERASTEVAMAKMYATEAAQRIIDMGVQLHGGLGVTLGTPVEQLYREIRPLRIYEGTTEIQSLIIGGALAKGTGS